MPAILLKKEKSGLMNNTAPCSWHRLPTASSGRWEQADKTLTTYRNPSLKNTPSEKDCSAGILSTAEGDPHTAIQRLVNDSTWV